MIPFLKKYQSGNNGDLIFSYSGSPSPEMINIIWQMTEIRMEKIEPAARLRKKVIHIVIEILQNIFHHREDFTIFQYNSFVFYLFRQKDNYFIVSGNFIRSDRAEHIVERIENYTSLSSSDQKEIYRETLANGFFSAKGGAGLGLMDIVRKSGGNLELKFIDVDKSNLFLLMEIVVM
jgi:hypothetical protein